MAEANIPAPESFDLKTQDAGVSGDGIALDDVGLSWSSGKEQRRRAFGDISNIDLDKRMGGHYPTAWCYISFADRAQLTVRMKNDMPKEVMIYRGFVLALFERLGAENQSRITFRYGYSPERQRLHIVLSAVALVVAIVAFLVAAFLDELHQEANGWIAYVLILLFIGMLSGVLWKSVTGGQKPNKNPRSKLRGIGGRKEADQKNAASCGEYVPKEIQAR
jgi:hypothetical protein